MQAGLLKKNLELSNLLVEDLDPPLNCFVPNFQFSVVLYRLFRSPSLDVACLPVGVRVTLKDLKRLHYRPWPLATTLVT
ncbi:hypothetical protein [Nostoc sp.]|uniref:hypothetical protein n=1 Tax=Nostoc sp. TaxID=1180 RepID=UPI002FF4A7C6